MTKILILAACLVLVGCGKSGTSSPLVGSYQLTNMVDSGRAVATPNMLEISNSTMVEGGCTVTYVANEGRIYFETKTVGPFSCPFLSRVDVQDEVAYTLDGTTLNISAKSANGDYITIVAGRN